MPAPASTTYSAAVLVACHTTLLGRIDAGPSASKLVPMAFWWTVTTLRY